MVTEDYCSRKSHTSLLPIGYCYIAHLHSTIAKARENYVPEQISSSTGKSDNIKQKRISPEDQTDHVEKETATTQKVTITIRDDSPYAMMSKVQVKNLWAQVVTWCSD